MHVYSTVHSIVFSDMLWLEEQYSNMQQMDQELRGIGKGRHIILCRQYVIMCLKLDGFFCT